MKINTSILKEKDCSEEDIKLFLELNGDNEVDVWDVINKIHNDKISTNFNYWLFDTFKLTGECLIYWDIQHYSLICKTDVEPKIYSRSAIVDGELSRSCEYDLSGNIVLETERIDENTRSAITREYTRGTVLVKEKHFKIRKKKDGFLWSKIEED